MSEEFPTGTVTLVFTDIENSSVLWEQHRAVFPAVLEAHHRIVRAAAARRRGFEVKTAGDSFFLVFAGASDAVQFAVDTQRALRRQDWDAIAPGMPELRVRIGLHTGEPLVSEEAGSPAYDGPAVNRAARVSDAARGGQVVVSLATRLVAAPDPGSEITFADLGLHRLRGVGEEHLWQLCHPELPREFPPPRTLDPKRHNLPIPPTPFIGRAVEIARCREFLARPEVRLVTLVGTGGMGKTRCALQLAELLLDELPEGVCWVELEEVHTGEGMLGRLASQLGLHLQPQLSVQEQLFQYLRDRQLLLVLNNVEQIPDAPRITAELLRAAPRVRCLVTSRRSLQVRAEQVVEIGPLPGGDAEALFIQSAQARRADFSTEGEEAAAVAELCRRLDGVPLAIELAASRIDVMTPREMLDRLRERFRLLQARSDDLPPRFRTLWATIDWSYDLLPDEERSLFAQLSVFAGGFAMEDAEAICEAPDVFEGVVELRRQSLLRAETEPGSRRTRYSMLDSVREYAAEKQRLLPEAGEALRQRHAEHFLSFGEARAGRMRTPAEIEALEDLSREYDNLCAALAWAESASADVLCGRLALVLYGLLFRRGFWTEARRVLDTGWEAAGRLSPPSSDLRASLARGRARLALEMGDLVFARTMAEISVRECQACGSPAGVADTLYTMALLYLRERNPAEADRLFEEALRTAPEEEHARRGMVLRGIAARAAQRGEHALSRRLYEEALQHHRTVGDRRGEGEALSNIGALAHDTGELAEAREYYLASLSLSSSLGDRPVIAVTLHNLGELADQVGETGTAVALFSHAARMLREVQSTYASVPEEWLERIAARLGSEEFGKLRAASEAQSWQEVVEHLLDPARSRGA